MLEETPQERDSELVKILRGMSFVHMYGAYEYSITGGVQALLRHITAEQVEFFKLEPLFHTISLNSEFDALSDTKSKRKWVARKDLLVKQLSQELCSVSDTCMDANLQNLRCRSLESIFDCLCIAQPIVPQERFRGYIDEVVNKRHAIAHGRLSPAEVGQMHSKDIENRFNALSCTVTHILFLFDGYLGAYEFVSETHRQAYICGTVTNTDDVSK